MSPLVKFIVFSIAFVKGGAFLSLPYLTIHLQKHFGASAAITGLIIGLNPLASVVVSFWSGYLSDLWGRKGILRGSIFLCALSYLSFAVASELWHFALGSLALGAASGALQTTLRALLSDLTAPAKRPFVFRLHYFMINVGASVGPLFGAHFLLANSSSGFFITGSLYLIYLVAFHWVDRFTVNENHDTEVRTQISFAQCMGVLRADVAFLLFVSGSLLMSLTYSQIDTLLPRYLNDLLGDNGIRLFGWLLAANSMTVIVGLYPATWIANRIGPLQSVLWGQALMSLGFAAVAFVGDSIPLLFASMILLTIGEVMAFSNWSLVVDSYAKPGLRGSYFGASSFGHIGNSVGPMLGGAFYQFGGAYFAFNFLGFLSMFGILFYLRAEKSRAAQQDLEFALT